MSLHLGATTKCAFTRRPNPPGIHGPAGQRRLSTYGQQLREKQKAKGLYGVLERQFVNYFKKAQLQKGNTAENLVRLLETRLDTLVCVSQIAPSQPAARQLVAHGHIMVNGRTVNIPSYQVKIGDKITLRPQSVQKKNLVERFSKMDEKLLPGWIAVDKNAGIVTLSGNPPYEDMSRGIQYKHIIEYYSR